MTSLRRSAGRGPHVLGEDCNASPDEGTLPTSLHRLGGAETANVSRSGMVQKHPFSGNTRDLSADPDRSRVGAGLRESLAAVLGLQFRENRVYPRSSSQ